MALGALVAAGMAGMRAGARLPQPVAVDPASLSATEAAAIGLTRLPASLAAALECLMADQGTLTLFPHSESVCVLKKILVLQHQMRLGHERL